MKADIIVPPLSQTKDTLILLEWFKHLGDPVEKGEVLFSVETDKASLEVEAPASGFLTEIMAEPGTEVKVRSIIGTISKDDKLFFKQTLTGPNGDPLPPERLSRIFASPRARNLASIEGIDLSSITPSGPMSMIVERDVTAYLKERDSRAHSTPRITPVARRVAEDSGINIDELVKQTASSQVIRRADVESILETSTSETSYSGGRSPMKISPTRRTIATRMMESHLNTAPFTLTREADATELVALRQKILDELSENDPRPTYTDFLIMITARCLKEFPQLNATFYGTTLEMYHEINLSLAVDTERGLLTPVINNIQNKRLLEIAQERQNMVKRTQNASITPSEMSGGTFTMTNLGAIGIDAFTPILNIPQVAILGIGRIHAVPAVFQNTVSIRQVVTLSLTVDHRVIDGGPAARFLMLVVNRIEKPHLSWL